MGDFRFSFKATFKMGNVEDETDMWLNWSAHDGDCHPIDRRVIEWLRMNFQRGVNDIQNSLYDAIDDERERDEENRILMIADEIRARRKEGITR